MRGWMIVFATAAVSSAGMTTNGHTSPSAKVTSCVFAILFVLGLVARGLRGRAW
jgi:hypothetical protein